MFIVEFSQTTAIDLELFLYLKLFLYLELFLYLQKHFPVRIKGIHVYNAGAFTEFILMLVKLAMSSKIQKRVSIEHQHYKTVTSFS